MDVTYCDNKIYYYDKILIRLEITDSQLRKSSNNHFFHEEKKIKGFCFIKIISKNCKKLKIVYSNESI